MLLYRKKILILAMAMILCGVCVLPWPRAAYAAPSAEPTKSTIADKLILQLGPDWAGVEFELVTDVGKYPGTIVVDDAGVLTLKLATAPLSSSPVSIPKQRRLFQRCKSRRSRRPPPWIRPAILQTRPNLAIPLRRMRMKQSNLLTTQQRRHPNRLNLLMSPSREFRRCSWYCLSAGQCSA